MKTKLLAVLAALGMVASASAVKVNNNLSINGFIDGSYKLTDTAGADDQSLGLDEVELNFNLNVGNVSGLIAIDNNNPLTHSHTVSFTDLNGTNSVDKTVNSSAVNGTDLNIEQAHFTYNLSDSVSITFGRYGSALGLEGEDPAGLYTFSRAYKDSSGFNFANIDNNTNGAVEGITIAYAGDAYSIAASFEEAAGTDIEANDLNLELSFTYTGIAGLNIGGGYFFDNAEGTETDSLNLYASRQLGKLLIAGEYSERSTSTAGSADIDNDAYLLLADYDVNDKLGVAVRFSNHEQGTTGDYEKFTLAPNYAITDSLGAIIEYSDVDDAGTDSEEYAVELTYTF
jgi:hypothetical protein